MGDRPMRLSVGDWEILRLSRRAPHRAAHYSRCVPLRGSSIRFRSVRPTGVGDKKVSAELCRRCDDSTTHALAGGLAGGIYL